MNKSSTNVFAVVVVVLVIAGLGGYTYLNNRSKKNPDSLVQSETQKLLEYDFEENYPKTVRETVNLHCRYLKNAYNNQFKEENLYTVNANIRKLLDDELLALNPEEQQLEGLKTDIALYKEKKQRFVSYSLEESSQVQYNTEEGKDYAKISAVFTFTVHSVAVTAEQEYLLRKDNDGKWKIIGWQTVEETSDKSEGDKE